jgi:acyl-CoA thioesterase I
MNFMKDQEIKLKIKRVLQAKVALLAVTFLIFTVNNTNGQNKTILFFGDSITAGYGLDPDDAFPAVVQQKIDSLGLEYRVVNSGVSGETSAGGLRRIDWVLQQPVDIFVLELGGNDGLRGIDPASTKENLQGIMDKVRARYPDADIILTGMEAPPNMGQSYTNEFRSIFSELAEANDVIFLPFILEGVAGEPELNLPDGIHPTKEGHKILARNVWEVLKPVINR